MQSCSTVREIGKAVFRIRFASKHFGRETFAMRHHATRISFQRVAVIFPDRGLTSVYVRIGQFVLSACDTSTG
jgi:hypothetical protein